MKSIAFAFIMIRSAVADSTRRNTDSAAGRSGKLVKELWITETSEADTIRITAIAITAATDAEITIAAAMGAITGTVRW